MISDGDVGDINGNGLHR